jgi:lipopolysaccharide export system permease protein
MLQVFKLKIIDKYILKEVIGASIGTFLILMLIFLANTLRIVLENIMDGILPLKSLMPIFITEIISFSLTLLPLGLYVGVILGLGRLYKDSEMAVLSACSWTPVNTLKITIVLASVVATIISLFSLFISPMVEKINLEIHNKMKGQSKIFALEAGKFNLTKDQNSVFFSHKLSENKLSHKDVFASNNNNTATTIENAKQAKIQEIKKYKGDYFIFSEGSVIYENDNQTSVVEFKEHGTKFGKGKLGQKTTLSSVTSIDLLRSSDSRYIGELQMRISMPIATILLAALAVPLSFNNPRAGRFGKLVLALSVYILYSVALRFANILVSDGHVSPVIGMWWVHIVVALLALTFIKKQLGKKNNL